MRRFDLHMVGREEQTPPSAFDVRADLERRLTAQRELSGAAIQAALVLGFLWGAVATVVIGWLW